MDDNCFCSLFYEVPYDVDTIVRSFSKFPFDSSRSPPSPNCVGNIVYDRAELQSCKTISFPYPSRSGLLGKERI